VPGLSNRSPPTGASPNPFSQVFYTAFFQVSKLEGNITASLRLAQPAGLHKVQREKSLLSPTETRNYIAGIEYTGTPTWTPLMEQILSTTYTLKGQRCA